MRTKALLLAFIFISLPTASLPQTKRQFQAKKQLPADPLLAPSGELSWRYKSWKHSRQLCRIAMRRDYLSPSLLDRIEKSIEFAYNAGAARKIDELDLDHAHLLFDKKEEISPVLDIQNPDSILLHAQEYIHYEPPSFRKRNIFSSRSGIPEILPCKIKYYEPSGNLPRLEDCTVFTEDLNMMEAPFMILFVRVDNVSKALLLPYAQNIRVIRGQKILFAIPNYDYDECREY